MENMNLTGNACTEVLTLTAGKRLTMTCVTAVDGFTDTSLKLTVGKRRVIISGANIKIAAYDNVKGTFTADGSFNKISYEGEKTSLVKKLFK